MESHRTYCNRISNEILKPLGYPIDDGKIVKRDNENTYKLFGNKKSQADDIYYINNEPSLVIEFKPNPKDFDEAYNTALFHAKNFKYEFKIPFLIASAGNKVVMYKLIRSKDNLGESCIELPNLLSWEELKKELEKILKPSTLAEVVESAKSLRYLTNIFKEIKTNLSKYNDEVSVQIINKLAKANIYRNYNEVEKIFSNNKVSKKYKNIINEILNRYNLSKVNGNDIAYAYREFITDYYKGYSDQKYLQRTGRYITPTEIIKFMVKISDIKPSYKIIDPSCGSGGFLAGVLGVIPEDKKVNFTENNLYGCDIDPFCISNSKTFIELILKDKKYNKINIYLHNGLYCEDNENGNLKQENICNFIKEETFDLVISNPPGNNIYSGGFDSGFVSKKLDVKGKFFDTKAFIKRALRLTKDKGKICLVIPDSFFSNIKLNNFRENIFSNNKPKAIISLPRYIFPHVNAKMAVILLEKGVKYSEDLPIFMASIELDEEHPSLEAELDNVYKEFIEFKNL